MIRIGSALFNADHTRLGEEMRRTEDAGIDFWHLDVFDGYFVPDQAFSPRTIRALRPLSRLPFEVHLAVNDPLRFLGPLADAGVDLVLLPVESTPLLYETIFAVRERGMKAGLCLALGTPISLLSAVLPMLDTVLLLGRVTGEGKRGRDFNDLVVERVREVRRRIDAAGLTVDLQAAGGLETPHCVAVCQAGATSLPLGSALHREPDMPAFVSMLRAEIATATNDQRGPRGDRGESGGAGKTTNDVDRSVPPSPVSAVARAGGAPALTPVPPSPRLPVVLIASRSFGRHCPEVPVQMEAAGCVLERFPFERAPTEEELIARIGEADALISGTELVTARVLAAAGRLRVIAKHGVGYENIDLEAARARGVPVAIAGGAIADSVADLTLGLLLAAARQIPAGNASVRAGEWKRFVGPELAGKTLGIVGLGQIGKAVCRRARGFGLQIAAHDVRPDPAFTASWGVEYLPLEELLERSDFVTLHAPAAPRDPDGRVVALIGAAELAQMKPGSYLVNTARGELVDETALAAALASGALAGAASDVFSREPPGESPLLSLPNFVAMPHCAGQTPEGLRRMGEITAENVLRALRGEEPGYRVA